MTSSEQIGSFKNNQCRFIAAKGQAEGYVIATGSFLKKIRMARISVSRAEDQDQEDQIKLRVRDHGTSSMKGLAIEPTSAMPFILTDTEKEKRLPSRENQSGVRSVPARTSGCACLQVQRHFLRERRRNRLSQRSTKRIWRPKVRSRSKRHTTSNQQNTNQICAR